MTKSGAPQGPPAASWIPTAPSGSARRHKGRQAAAITVRGHGSCTANTAAAHMIGEAAVAHGIDTYTPWGMMLALDANSKNPVLMPSNQPDPEGVPIAWTKGGRRATFNLDAAFRAWDKPVTATRHESWSIPLELATNPADATPGLMLQWSGLVIRHVTPRGPRKLAKAQRDAAHAQATLARMEAAAGKTPENR